MNNKRDQAGNNPAAGGSPAGASPERGIGITEGCADLSLLIMITWKEEGEWYLYRALAERCRAVEILQPFRPRGVWARFLGRVSAGLASLCLPLRAVARRKRFDFVLSWSMRMGVWYGILNRVCGREGAPPHILRDFHVNLVRRDWRYRLRLRLLRFALPGIDGVLCTSREEARLYAELFGIPPGRICFFPDVPPSQFLAMPPAEAVSDYVFAYGNSDRDFETLIEAVRVLPLEVVILSQQFAPSTPLPGNVRLLTETVSVDRLTDLIRSARLVVLPLQHHDVAAGQNSMLETMALGRPLIVASNLATREYAQDGVSALYFPPGDALALRSVLQDAGARAAAMEAMGKRAHDGVKALLDDQVALLCDILERWKPIRK